MAAARNLVLLVMENDLLPGSRKMRLPGCASLVDAVAALQANFAGVLTQTLAPADLVMTFPAGRPQDAVAVTALADLKDVDKVMLWPRWKLAPAPKPSVPKPSAPKPGAVVELVPSDEEFSNESDEEDAGDRRPREDEGKAASMTSVGSVNLSDFSDFSDEEPSRQTSSAAGQGAEEREMITVSVPERGRAGDALLLATGAGEELEVVVPVGAAAADEIEVSTPWRRAAAAASATVNADPAASATQAEARPTLAAKLAATRAAMEVRQSRRYLRGSRC
jgi:hypothetical protein